MIEQSIDFSMKKQIKHLMKVTLKEPLRMKFLMFELKMLMDMKSLLNKYLKKKRKKVLKDLRSYFCVVECINLEEIGFMKDLTSVFMNINSLI